MRRWLYTVLYTSVYSIQYTFYVVSVLSGDWHCFSTTRFSLVGGVQSAGDAAVAEARKIAAAMMAQDNIWTLIKCLWKWTTVTCKQWNTAFPTSKRPIWMGQLKVTLIWYKTLSKTESYSPQFQTWMARPLGTKTLQVVVCRILMMLPWGKTSSWMEWDYPMLIARLTLHFAFMLKGI